MTMSDDRDRLMDPGTKLSSLQSYQTILYGRALHPELFTLRARRHVETADFEFEAWLTPGGHIIRFERGRVCACELVSDAEENLPSTGVLSALLCAGEREFEHRFERSDVNYMTSVQTETLSENLYLATFDELASFAEECKALVHRYDTPYGPSLSVLDFQVYSGEVHVQAYHLQAPGYLVLRTQSIFERKGAG